MNLTDCSRSRGRPRDDALTRTAPEGKAAHGMAAPKGTAVADAITEFSRGNTDAGEGGRRAGHGTVRGDGHELLSLLDSTGGL